MVRGGEEGFKDLQFLRAGTRGETIAPRFFLCIDSKVHCPPAEDASGLPSPLRAPCHRDYPRDDATRRLALTPADILGSPLATLPATGRRGRHARTALFSSSRRSISDEILQRAIISCLLAYAVSGVILAVLAILRYAGVAGIIVGGAHLAFLTLMIIGIIIGERREARLARGRNR